MGRFPRRLEQCPFIWELGPAHAKKKVGPSTGYDTQILCSKFPFSERIEVSVFQI